MNAKNWLKKVDVMMDFFEILEYGNVINRATQDNIQIKKILNSEKN